MPENNVSGIEKIRAEQAAVAAFDANRDLPPGALSPRRRVSDLLDGGSLFEMAARTRSQRPELRESSFGDGVVAAFGRVRGRTVAVLADDPLAMAGSDGAVGKNKRLRLLTHAAQGCLPIVYFAEASSADGEAPAEGGLLGRYSDGTNIVPEVYLGSREEPAISVLCGPVAPELEDLVLRSDVVVATPAAEASRRADVSVADDTAAIAAVRGLLQLIPSGNPAPLGRAIEPARGAARPLPDVGASALGLAALAEGLFDSGTFLDCSPAGAGNSGFLCGLGAISGFALGFAGGEQPFEAE